jgi:hypothetical protein
VGHFFNYESLFLISLALGAHLPDLSSEMEFLDVLHLGIFAILSPAFDERFYHGQKPEPSLVAEIACAVAHFRSILAAFSERFIILLDGVPVKHHYVFNRMLAEFSAATVVFCKAVDDERGDREELIKSSEFIANIEGILQASYPKIFPYYSRCVERKHSHFIWTGPKLQIVPRSEGSASLIALVGKGEMLDSPTQPIYDVEVGPELPVRPTPAGEGGKRPAPDDSDIPVSRPPKLRKTKS